MHATYSVRTTQVLSVYCLQCVRSSTTVSAKSGQRNIATKEAGEDQRNGPREPQGVVRKGREGVIAGGFSCGCCQGGSR